MSGERTFVKTYPAHARHEFLRGRAIAETGKRTGLFRAPEPLELLEARDIIMWEYLDDLTEIRDYVGQRTRTASGIRECGELFFTSGRALAAIHDGLLEVDSDREFSPISGVRSGNASLDRHVASELAKCPRRPLHWDFCCGNLFVTSSRGAAPALVILDAMPNHYVLQPSGPAVVCPIYVDIAQMIFSLCCHPGFSRVLGSAADDFVTAFLSGYSFQSGLQLDHATALACAAEVNRIYQKFKDESDVPGYSLGAILDRRFRRSVGRRLDTAALKLLAAGTPGERVRTPDPLVRA